MIALLMTLALQDVSEHVKPLEWMVGTWEGEGSLDEMPFKATVKCEWAMNKNFIRSSFSAKAGDQIMWEDTGMFGWDRDKKKLVMFSFGMDGTIGTGDEVASTEKDTWILDTKLNSEDPRFKEGRAIIKRIDADTYSDTAQMKKDGAYVTFLTCTYKRVKVSEK